MAKKNNHQSEPLTRWTYFCKNLYNNTANSVNFTYNKVVYEKSEALQAIDDKAQKVNYVLLLGLILMFFLTSQIQNIYFVIAYLLLAVVGEAYRFLLLPKNITDHLTDTGFRDR